MTFPEITAAIAALEPFAQLEFSRRDCRDDDVARPYLRVSELAAADKALAGLKQWAERQEAGTAVQPVDTSASGPDAVARAIVERFTHAESPFISGVLINSIAFALAAAEKRGAEQEREACAKIADKETKQKSGCDQIERAEARYIASMIRARS